MKGDVKSSFFGRKGGGPFNFDPVPTYGEKKKREREGEAERERERKRDMVMRDPGPLTRLPEKSVSFAKGPIFWICRYRQFA
jgi:hypothetical protein